MCRAMVSPSPAPLAGEGQVLSPALLEQGGQPALVGQGPVVRQGGQGPFPPAAQGQGDPPLAGGLGGVGDQAQQQPPEQLRVAGDQQAAARALQLQGDPRLLEQGPGLGHRLTAQILQVHGDGPEEEAVSLRRLLEILQVAHQAEQPVEALGKGPGVHRLLGRSGGGAHLGQDLPQQGAQLIQRPVHLPAGEGGLRGGAEEDQLLAAGAGAAVGVAGRTGGEGPRPHGARLGQNQLLRHRGPRHQEGQIVPGHGVGLQDRALPGLDHPLGEGVQQGSYRIKHIKGPF